VAESKDRHLVKTTRTLLIHGNVPQYFWGDVILSACYLINRMSSLVLENKIFHSILFPYESLHLLPRKVFESTCFVHNFSPGLDKLSAQSHKCVFLGFTGSQKRYTCFSPSIIISFLQMSPLLNLLFYFKSLSSPLTSSSSQIHIPVVCDSLVMSNVQMSPLLNLLFYFKSSSSPLTS